MPDQPENVHPSPAMQAEARRLGLEYGRVFGRDTAKAHFLYTFPENKCGGTTIMVPVTGTAADLAREHDETVAKWEVFEYPDNADTPAIKFPMAQPSVESMPAARGA